MDSELENIIIKEKLEKLPEKPGVYIMQNAQHKVIYVGKAKVLKNRVRSYFNNSSQSIKTKILVSQIDNFNYIVTANEMEALILECNLIKKYAPKYNILLKDGKTYPYLKITLYEDYPRIYLRRHVEQDGSIYFGPFADAHALNITLTLLEKVFKLRTCKRMQSKRPCMRYYIKECMGPCQGYVDSVTYKKMINEAILFLNGKNTKLISDLKDKINKASAELRFEEAIIYKNQIDAIEKIQQEQTVVSSTGDNIDVIGIAESEKLSCVQVLSVREGKLLGQKYFYLQNIPEDSQADRLNDFLKQYYTQTTFIPDEVLVPRNTADTVLLEEFLKKQHKKSVKFSAPQRGKKIDLIKMAQENANIKLYEAVSAETQEREKKASALGELADALGIKSNIVRIECFDISHNQGHQTVASMVVFIDGVPAKKCYKRYKLKTVEGKPDDFMSMKEVISRRYSNGDDIPDLIVIDGGKGQLSSVMESLTELGLAGHVPVVSLAKQFEHIFMPNSSEPIIMDKSSGALHILQNIRDEAHRFAITYHRKLREKRGIRSLLEYVEGIGPAKRVALMEHFKNIAAIKKATIRDLANVRGMSIESAKAVYEFFRRE